MVALKDALSELAKVSQELNAASDTINETIAAVDNAIDASGPGTSTWLYNWELCREHTIDAESERSWSNFWVIGYDRRESDGKFGLVAQEWTAPTTEDYHGESGIGHQESRAVSTVRALADCRRDVRIAAVPRLEDLVLAIAKSAKGSLDALHRARSLLVE